MIFQSIDFLIFLLLTVAVHWTLPQRFRNIFLLLASYFFYGYIHPWFLFLLWFVTVAVYGCGLAMSRWEQYRKPFFWLGIASCLAMLGVFKYFHFFVDNVVVVLQAIGFGVSKPTLQIFLPVGISFFAFQGMSYVIDVYRGTIRARTNFVDVALFKAFFPQLVAGPIERATHLLPQLERPRQFLAERALDGLFLLIWGFFKKLVIADNVSIVANKVFLLEDPAFPVLWAGVFAFCVQIFADFSAYTDIARGSAKLLGINLIENFRHPYLASSPVDFWRRWHLSLSTWFRDYVYIPLGGNRDGRLIGARNVMITFLLSGLWHGASWNYVLWGAYWGFLIVAYNTLNDIVPLRWTSPRTLLPAKILLTFVLTNIGWLLFRETNFHYLLHYLSMSPFAASRLEWQAGAYFTVLVLLYALPIVAHMYIDTVLSRDGRTMMQRLATSLPAQAVVAVALFAAILVMRTAASGDFIYFQF